MCTVSFSFLILFLLLVIETLNTVTATTIGDDALDVDHPLVRTTDNNKRKQFLLFFQKYTEVENHGLPNASWIFSTRRGSAVQSVDHEPQSLNQDDESSTTSNLALGNGVLLIPGIAGSGLFATLNDANLPDCPNHGKSAPRHRLWVSIVDALPPRWRQQCWVEKISLHWGVPEACATSWWPDWLPWPFGRTDPMDSLVSACEPRYIPVPGVQIDVDSPGVTHGFDYLDYVEGIGVYGSRYFHDLIVKLKLAGYVEGDTLLGHPFDWRYPIWQLDFQTLKTTIEKFKSKYPNKKVVIIAHSLGAAMTNFFLTRLVSSLWKSEHIEAFIPVAGAFGGSHKAIEALVSGYGDMTTVDVFGLFNFSMAPPLLLRNAFRSFGSLYSMVPNLHLFGRDTPVIKIHTVHETRPVTITSRRRLDRTDDKSSGTLAPLFQSLLSTSQSSDGEIFESLEDAVLNYTLSDWWKLLPGEAQAKAKQAQEKITSDTALLLDPQVPVYCLWAALDSPSTDIAYEYDAGANSDAAPKMTFTMGDGTLTVESASYCRSWKSTVLSREFEHLDHMRILWDRDFIRFVVSLVSGSSDVFPPAGVFDVAVES